MTYALIPVLCVLAASKVTLQSRFSKTKGRGAADSIFYNGMTFLTVAALFCPLLIRNGATRATLFFGAMMGILSVAFQLFYLLAFSRGKMTLTVILNNFSMILPMAVSVIAFGEPFGVTKALGTALALISFCLTVARKKKTAERPSDKCDWLWLTFTLLVFLSNGLISINQKTYAAVSESLQPFEFVAVAYITASLLSFLLLGALALGKKSNPQKPTVRAMLSPCLVGLLLGVFQVLNTYAASVLDGTVLYSTYNCGISVLLCVIGRVLFRETLSKRQYAGVAIGIAAIVFLCL